MTTTRPTVWLLRAVWLLLPFVTGPAFASALDERSEPVRTTASVGLWAGWVAVLVATLVLHPVALTVVRLAAPSAFAAVVFAAFADEPSPIAVAAVSVAAVVAFAGATGQAFIDGPAYANERRFPLRVPTALLFGPLVVSWAIVVGGPAAGILLIAADRLVAGVIVLIVALPMAVVLFRALYGLGRRWVVFVPAGLVIHDPMTLADPVLFRRPSIASLHASDGHGDDAADFTQRAAGLSLVLELREPAVVARVKPGRRQVPTEESVARIRFAPTRPGAVLAEARERRIPTATT